MTASLMRVLWQLIKSISCVLFSFWLYSKFDLSTLIAFIPAKTASANIAIYTAISALAFSLFELLYENFIGHISVKLSGTTNQLHSQDIILNDQIPSLLFVEIEAKGRLRFLDYVNLLIFVPNGITMQPDESKNKVVEMKNAKNAISISLRGMKNSGLTKHTISLLNAEPPAEYSYDITCIFKPSIFCLFMRFHSNTIKARYYAS